MQTYTFEEITKVQPRGILTIPKKIRLDLGLEDNPFVKIKKDGYRIIIEPVKILPYPVRNYSEKEIKEFFELDKIETKRLKQKGLL